MDITTDARTTKLGMERVEMHKRAKTSSDLRKFQVYMLLY